jgi:hypothetical protein
MLTPRTAQAGKPSRSAALAPLCLRGHIFSCHEGTKTQKNSYYKSETSVPYWDTTILLILGVSRKAAKGKEAKGDVFAALIPSLC